MKNYISVIMPTYNKETRLMLALKSLENQDFPLDQWELVLVDDGSKKNTKEMVDKLNLKINYKYIFQDNSGRSVARNKGIANSKGNILVFMDDDLIASPQFLTNHAMLHISHEYDNLIVHGAIYEITYSKFFEDPINGVLYSEYGEYENKVPKLEEKCNKILSFKEDFALFSRYFSKKTRFERGVEYELTLPQNRQAVPWIGFNGGNVSVARCIVEKAGCFDEKLGKKWGAEDIELGFRINELDVLWMYSNAACNYHISHYRKNVFEVGKESHEYCKKKHPTIAMEYLWNFLTDELSISEFNDIVKNKEDYNE